MENTKNFIVENSFVRDSVVENSWGWVHWVQGVDKPNAFLTTVVEILRIIDEVVRPILPRNKKRLLLQLVLSFQSKKNGK